VLEVGGCKPASFDQLLSDDLDHMLVLAQQVICALVPKLAEGLAPVIREPPNQIEKYSVVVATRQMLRSAVPDVLCFQTCEAKCDLIDEGQTTRTADISAAAPVVRIDVEVSNLQAQRRRDNRVPGFVEARSDWPRCHGCSLSTARRPASVIRSVATSIASRPAQMCCAATVASPAEGE
jgi:hypothetical protein